MDSNPPRRPKRGRRPEPEPEPPSRLGYWLLAFCLLGLVGILVSRSSGEGSTEVAVQPPPPEPPPPSRPPPPVPRAPAAVAPQVQPPPPPTPALDLLVRLEARRRIQRAGASVYLDSLLAESDSVLRRWPERRGDDITVAFVQDSLFNAARIDASPARDAFARWQSLALGLRFSVISDTGRADIVVRWIDRFDPEDERTGESDIEVGFDGAIRRAEITLALRDPQGRLLGLADQGSAAMHEVGHALGLGHSTQPGDVMHPSPRSGSLSARDRRTAELIYGLPPGSVKGGGP